MNRRGFLQSILAAGVAPYVVTAAGVLMPVRKIVVAPGYIAGQAWFLGANGLMSISPMGMWAGAAAAALPVTL